MNSKIRILLIIAWCILITFDIWTERTVYHYTLQSLHLYALTITGLVNWLLAYRETYVKTKMVPV